MVFFGVDQEEKRRQDLKAVLDIQDGYPENNFKKVRRFLKQYGKTSLIAAIVVLTILTHIYIYNLLVPMRAKVRGSRAQIMSALQMRQNLVPALTVLIHHFVMHEENIFLNTAKKREEMVGGHQDKNDLAQSLKMLEAGGVSSKALSRLMAVAENYPQLRSSESLQLVIGKLAEVESNVLVKRNEYNNVVTSYNSFLEVFPINFVAIVFGFKGEPFFTCDEKPEWIFKQKQDDTEFKLSIASGSQNRTPDSAVLKETIRENETEGNS